MVVHLLTPEERLAQDEHQKQSWRRIFLPIESHYIGLKQPWLVQDWLPIGTLAILASPPKQGKTALATALALAVATGTPFAGMNTRHGGVLWLSQEESMWDRLRLMEQYPGLDPLVPLFTTYDHLPVDQPETMELLSFWIQETSAKLLVVDPLHGATSGRSLVDGWSARRTLDPLRQLCQSHNVTALVLHHSKRAALSQGRQRVAESDQLAATSGMNIVLSTRLLACPPRPSEGEGLGVRALSPLDHETSSHRAEAIKNTSPGSAGKVGEAPAEPGGGNPENAAQHSSPQPLASTRIVTLDCTGRGPFANRSLQLLSTGPLDYHLQDQLPTGDPSAKAHVPYAKQILDLLEAHGPLSSAAIIAHLELPDNSARVALSRLVKQRFVTWKSKDGERIYQLAAQETC